MNPTTTLSDWLMRFAWLFYIVSLALPAIDNTLDGSEKVYGIKLLAMSPLMFFIAFFLHPLGLLAVLSWATNLVFCTTWFTYRSIKRGSARAIPWLLPSCILVNIVVVVLSIPTGTRIAMLPGLLHNPGYYLWFSAFVLAYAAVYAANKNAKSAI